MMFRHCQLDRFRFTTSVPPEMLPERLLPMGEESHALGWGHRLHSSRRASCVSVFLSLGFLVAGAMRLAALCSCCWAFNAMAHCIPSNRKPKEAIPSLRCFLSSILTISFKECPGFCLSCRISNHTIVHDISILSI